MQYTVLYLVRTDLFLLYDRLFSFPLLSFYTSIPSPLSFLPDSSIRLTNTMSTIKSVGGDPPTQARFCIEYKRPTALLLLTILTLYPSPSPLFHITCLPVFILLHRHKRSLFTIYSPICLSGVTLAADLREGREMVFAGVYHLMVASAIIGIVAGHHRLLSIQRVAWVEGLLFGLLWSGSGMAFRAFHQVSYMDSKSGELISSHSSLPQAHDMNPFDASPEI